MHVLDVGCGKRKTPGAIGIDSNPRTDADIIHDLNTFPYPFSNNEFDKVICNHILEHLDDIVKTINELYRIIKPGGILCIKVPYFAHPDAFRDPTHRRFFTLRSFDYFTEEDKEYSFYTEKKFNLLRRRLTFGSLKKVIPFIELFANQFPRVYETFFSRLFPAQTIEFELIKFS